MHATTFPPAVLAAALGACESEPVLLNSERIEKRFGSYGISILASEQGLRRSSLFSLENGKPVCRTYAVVSFFDRLDERYREEHAKVLAGNSIGAIFRSHGWDVHKQTLYIGSLSLADADAAIGRLMLLTGPRTLALHIYQLLLKRSEQVVEYATIIEAHHPDYMAENDLVELYPYDTTTALPSQTVAELSALVLQDADPG